MKKMNIKQKNTSIGNYNQISKYNLGMQAFEKILQLMNKATVIGHEARRKYKNKYILDYFSILITLYKPIRPALPDNMRTDIEDKIDNIKNNYIDIFNKRIRGKKTDVVDKLSKLEDDLYDAMQSIQMYIQLSKDFKRISKKGSFMQHLEGSDIDLENDEWLDD